MPHQENVQYVKSRERDQGVFQNPSKEEILAVSTHWESFSIQSEPSRDLSCASTVTVLQGFRVKMESHCAEKPSNRKDAALTEK